MRMNLTIAALALLVALAACAPAVQQQQGQTQQSGRAVLGVTDAAADMGAVSEVQVTIESASLRSASGVWTSVELDAKTFDLLDLKAQGATAVLADVEVPAGSYDQIRLEISDVVVTDAQGEHEAKLPSSELKLMGELDITADETASATFDFVADESLHMTGNGEYILAPVVQLETRKDADVSVDAKGHLSVQGGTVKTKAKVGMGADGTVGVDVRLPADAVVEIENGKLKVGGEVGLGLGAKGEADGAEGEGNATATGNLDVGAALP